MSNQSTIPGSASLDDAILALHASSDWKSLLGAVAEHAGRIFAAADARLLLSSGTGLPGLALRFAEGTVTEGRLDPRWLSGPMAAALRGKNLPCLLDSAAGAGDAARLPRALFPDQTFEAIVGLPVQQGRHDLHVLILVGGKALASFLEDARLVLFYRHFRVALERVMKTEVESASVLALRSFAGHSCTGLVALNWDLHPCYSNRTAIQLCAAWENGAEASGARTTKGRVSLPEDIFKVCVRLKKTLIGRPVDDGRVEAPCVIECPTLQGLRASIRLIQPPNSGIHCPFFKIRLERPMGISGRVNSVKEDIRNFLSPSERDILEVALEGLSNEEIATRMGKSLATVKSQIQSIYRKLSISNRSELIARISGFAQARSSR